MILLFIMFMLKITLAQLSWYNRGEEPPLVPGRRRADPTEYTYVVSIMEISEIHRCGGCLVSLNTVLTSASCIGTYSSFTERFYPLDESDIKIVGGSRTLNFQPLTFQVRYVERLILHPDLKLYQTRFWQNNVGVVKMTSPFKLTPYIHPLTISDKCFSGIPNAKLETFGWGKSCMVWNPVKKMFDYSGYSDYLHVIEFNLMSTFNCTDWLCTIYGEGNKEFLNTNRINGNYKELCGIADVGNTSGICSGDPGMPVVYNNALCGIVSWGMDCTHAPKSKFDFSTTHLVKDLDYQFNFIKSTTLSLIPNYLLQCLLIICFFIL